jgi:hypothetical protein
MYLEEGRAVRNVVARAEIEEERPEYVTISGS